MLAPKYLFSEINRLLSALRASFDVGSYPASVGPAHFREISEVYLAFESVRLSFRAAIHGYRGNNELFDVGPINQLVSELREFIANPMHRHFAEMARFRPLNMARTSSEFRIHPAFNENRLYAYQAIQFLIEGIDDFPFQHELFPVDEESVSKQVRKIVPKSQKVAPVKFEIIGGQLAILEQESTVSTEDYSNTIAANAHLVEQGEEIIKNLSGSNCDRRLLESVRGLQAHLKDGSNVVALGLKNLACNFLAEKFEPELPDALHSMLLAQTTGIGMLVAQYPEWQRFTENAASAKISSEDTPYVRNAINAVINEIENKPRAANPEVPKTLKALRAYLDDPAIESKRAVFAAWRTLENLAIVVFNYGADFIGQTAEKTSKKASSAASAGLAAALVGVALAGAVALAPAATHIPESAWLSKAVDLIEKQLAK